MEAPAEICRRLKEFHPWLRLGWDGNKRKFGLVQLYHAKDAKASFREFWRHQGPLFSASGRPEYHDYDGLLRKPMYLIDIEPRDVFSGKVVRLAKRWARPIAARMKESQDEQNYDRKKKYDDLRLSMADYVYSEGKRDNHAPIVAKKFVKPSENQVAFREGQFDKPRGHQFAPPPEGWDKAIEKDQGDASDLGDI